MRRCRRCCCMNNNFFNTMNNECNNNEILEESCKCIKNQDSYNETCNCGFDVEDDGMFPSNPMLAQSYVPIQTMNETFKPCVALRKGTLFPELVSLYNPGDSMKQIEYIKRTNMIGKGCNKCRNLMNQEIVVITTMN